MARGFSQTTLIGNVGNDPEVKYTQGGMAIARLSLATTSVRKDRDGNAQEITQWHRCVFFGKVAEIVAEYVKKGSQLFVQGEIRYDKFTGQDGQERYTTDIVCENMQMLGGGGNGGQQQGGNRQQQGGNRQQQGNGNGNGNGNGRGYGNRQQQPAQQPSAEDQPDYDAFPSDEDRPF